MTKLLTAILIIGTVSTACASESKIKMDASGDREISGQPSKEVARSSRGKVQEVERPESLKDEDSAAYKKHKQYIKYLDTHDRK